MRQSLTSTNNAEIRRLRYAKGLRRQELAVAARVSESHLGRIETGKRQGTPPVLRRIAEALGVAIEAIVTITPGAAGTAD